MFFQVATRKAVYGDLIFALPKGIGYFRAGLIWLYNLILLLTLVSICKLLYQR
jgi:H+-transporting ATPase